MANKCDWTLEEAKRWMKDHGKTIETTVALADKEGADIEELEDLLELDSENIEVVDLLDKGVIELEENEIKGATPHVALPLMPEKERWNPGDVPDSKIIEAILGRDPADGEWTEQMNANARKVCAWWDGKGGKIDAFKLKMGRRDPITDKSAPLKYNWRQTASRMAILMGARGGVDIPDEQRKPTYNRIAKVYKMFDKEPPEFKEYTEKELKEVFPEETVIKRPDLQGNPSIWDILDAIEGAINLGVIGPRRKWVTDLYPIKYPSGNVIIGIREEEVKYYLYSYTYDDGKITFGEATELEQTYKPKQTEREQQITRGLFDRLTEQLNKVEEELKALKEGRVLSEKNRKLVKQCADMLLQLYEATEPPKREEFELEIEEGKKDTGKGDKKLEIDKETLTLKIASIIKNKIEEMVQNALNRARGKVE